MEFKGEIIKVLIERFTALRLEKKIILLISTLIFFNIIYAGAAFAVTPNMTNNTSSNITNVTNQTPGIVNETINNTDNANFTPVNGYFINPGQTPVNSIDPSALKKQGITDVFVLTNRDNPNSTLTSFLAKFAGSGINVYAWVECFKDSNGNFFYPDNNTTLVNQVISNITSIAANYNVNGIMLDYIRYPGNAYLHPNATTYVDNFASAIRNNINTINNENISGKPRILLTAALMPETSVNAYYYGQDYSLLSNYLDYLSPMIYKGNYNANTNWIATTTAYIIAHSSKPVVSILQTYYSDSNPTPETSSELNLDIENAMDDGSYGYSLFRYGLIASDWTGYTPPPPAVISINPGINTIINTTSKVIKVTFSEPIKAGTMFIEFKTSNGTIIPFSTSINNNILTITPSILLTNGIKYQLILHTDSVKDLSGNNLAIYTSNFTVDTKPPLITSVNPAVNATGVSLTTPVTITFNENITTGANFTGIYIKNLSTNQTVSLASKTINGNVLTINQASNRPNGDNYQVYIPAGAVKDTIGSILASAYTYNFTSVKLVPMVTSTNPVNNATGVSLTSPITIKFNENITKGPNFNGIYIQNRNTGATAHLASVTISSNTLTIVQASSRLYNDTYQAIIPVGAVEDSTGDLSKAYFFNFTSVKLVPTVISTNPVNNATGISLTSPITIKFNENITKGPSFNGIYIRNLNTGATVHLASVTISGNTLTIIQASSRLYNDTYQVVIPAGAVKDLSGNNLAVAYSFKFKTI